MENLLKSESDRELFWIIAFIVGLFGIILTPLGAEIVYNTNFIEGQGHDNILISGIMIFAIGASLLFTFLIMVVMRKMKSRLKRLEKLQ